LNYALVKSVIVVNFLKINKNTKISGVFVQTNMVAAFYNYLRKQNLEGGGTKWKK